MSTPVTLVPVANPIQARATLTAEQVSAFKQLLSTSNLLNLPHDTTVTDIQQFLITVQPNGGGFLQVTVHTPVASVAPVAG